MKCLLKSLSIVALSAVAATALAAPRQLITHNTTDHESNAFVAGSIPSRHPTKAHSDGRVFWTAVRMACFGHIENGQCMALIKMDPNSANPIDIGVITMDLETGDITPKQIISNGYTITVNGPGETTISAN